MVLLRPVIAVVKVPVSGSLAVLATVVTRLAKPVTPLALNFAATPAGSAAYAVAKAAASKTSLP